MNINERARHRIELQALELEELFARNELVAQVEGGVVGPDGVTFRAHLHGAMPELLEDQLRADLKETFAPIRVHSTREGEAMLISLCHSPHLQLIGLYERGHSPAPCTALLGVTTDDTPVFVNFDDASLEHVLFIGSHSAGKTSALRSCAISLALSSRQSQVQMLFIAPQCDRPESGQSPGLMALHYLPHALAEVVTSAEDAAEVIGYLEEEARYRRTHHIALPTIVLFIDNVDALLEEGPGTVRKALQQLLARGAESGIHCIMAARPPQQSEHNELEKVLALKPLLRIVGRVDDARQSQASSLISQLGAENLQGKGDFLLARQDNPIRFQSAFVDPYDLHWCLETLQRQRPPALLARPTTARPPIFTRRAEHDDSQAFSFDGQKISLEARPVSSVLQ